MFISSSPMLSDPEQFGLDNETSNKAKLAELKKFPAEVISKYRNTPLTEYKVSAKESAIVMEADDQIVYYVQVIQQHLSTLGAASCTQLAVWRNDDYTTIVGGLAQFVVREILLKRYKYIVSDEVQTADGQRFWKLLIGNMYADGYEVGIIDQGKAVDWAPKDAFNAWWRVWSTKGWSNKTSSMCDRFVIAAK